MSRRRRAAGRPRAAARRRETGRRQETTSRGFVRSSLKICVRALPAAVVVTLAAQLPTQLLLGEVFGRRGITSAFWQEQYRSVADLAIGSLLLPALYAVFYRATLGERLAGLPRTIRWAYGGGAFKWIGTWLGMFMTRFLVSFVVGVAFLPALAGAWGVSRAWPAIGRVLAAPDRIASAIASAPATFAPMLLVVPLLVLPLAIWLRYALAEPAAALERIDGFEALKRSQELTSGARRHVLGGLVALYVPFQVAWFLLPEIAATAGPLAVGAMKACCLVLAAPFMAFLVEVFLAQGGAPRDERRPPEARPEPPDRA
jgi:hypothetical protein